MRILHLDPDDMDNPLSGGGPVRTWEIYRRLAARHEITILTPTFPGSTPEKIRDGIRYLRLGRRVGDHGSSHHITYWFALPAALRRHRYDLVVEDFMPPFSVTFNPLFARAPVVASVQWFMARQLTAQYHFPFHWGEQYGLRMYRNFVVLTESMGDLVRHRNPRARIRVIPNAVGDDRLFQVAPEPGSAILFLGRVDVGQKGVDLLLEAYARVPEGERLPLVLAGHGFQGERVDALVQRLGLAPWVRATGRVDAVERARLLQQSRFAVVPSRSETFGLTILEACAAARRVVVFDQAPMNEVAPRGPCLLVPPFDVDAYAQAMRALIRCPEAEMLDNGAQCRAWARSFNWDRVAAEQERFYEEVLANPNPRPGAR